MADIGVCCQAQTPVMTPVKTPMHREGDGHGPSIGS